MAEEPFKLLIMDSITANLRVDFSGRGELADRQQKLGQMMARLRKVQAAAPLQATQSLPQWRDTVLSDKALNDK